MYKHRSKLNSLVFPNASTDPNRLAVRVHYWHMWAHGWGVEKLKTQRAAVAKATHESRRFAGPVCLHAQALEERRHRWVPWAGCSQQLLAGRIRRSQRLAAQYEAIV
jgi:hypothetical protein